MDHVPQDHRTAGPSLRTDHDTTVEASPRQWDGHAARSGRYSVDLPSPGPPLISAAAAASALQGYFLANADRGDNAANDQLVAELVRRIRAQQTLRESGC